MMTGSSPSGGIKPPFSFSDLLVLSLLFFLLLNSLTCLCFKMSIRRACIGELIILRFILEFEPGKDVLRLKESSVLASGSRQDIGNWQMHLKSQNHLETHYRGFKTPDIVTLSDLVQQNRDVQEEKSLRLQLSDTSEDSSNIYVFQTSTMTQSTIDIAFVSGIREEMSNMANFIIRLTGLPLSGLHEEKHIAFDAKFKECFNLSEKLDPETLVVGKAALGTCLEALVTYNQKIHVPRSRLPKSEDDFFLYWPAELYTAVPSRPVFPRGFLWDEGFRQLLIWRWDVHITLEIVGSWLDLMNIDGWIPREQIMGVEALSKIPKQYVVQCPSNGNPPKLLLVIRGKEKGSYYWHGRDKITTKQLNPQVHSLLQQMHYDHDRGAYLDFGSVNLERGNWRRWSFISGACKGDNWETRAKLVPHIGYVSFFPFMFRIIPADSSILDKQLDLISNKSIVWSDYGLLSLAKTSSLYMKYNTEDEAPYWRGAIWMNMNYMILSSLHHYSKANGPYSSKARTIYEELRSNLIRNVVRNYDQTGYIWEHYDQTKGTGEGARVFTGRSSLILFNYV